MEFAFAAIVIAAVALALWLRVAAIRRDRLRIRRWADRKGYAVLDIRRARTRMEALRYAFGGMFVWWFSARSYEVRVQDEEGGQFTVLISLRGSRHFETHRL